ncbi:SPFH domain-containing protein [Candidatus Cryosericum septentrionale]|jgi:regulator of protease activity HflC (stomatin/prohibitin superfamily)|uniref:SPFH/Band 7/PHB domain protein n=1 Tax=Candidatus Cryosericum septentrionale TaxID=2290913 RepID=A0A398DNS0_9BACT|nr:SPFH domain-containing protein [Candidatus Cryosericum septentrionale]RIE17262.1 SPFH/Band 7/PHB domain protein [Candidatus Cryosericum septentrionale]
MPLTFNWSIVWWVVGIVVVLIFALRYIIIVRQSTAVIIERLGKFSRDLKPGLHFLIPILDSVRAVVDLREQAWDYPPQAVITKDNVPTSIDIVLYYYLTDPVKSVYEVRNLNEAILKLTMTSIRNISGSLNLDELLVSRENVNNELTQIVDVATDPWGVKVTRAEIKAVNPPAEILEAMTRQMKAERSKRAVILEAEGFKEAEINKAEGEKQAAILRAEGDRQQRILSAEGEGQALITVANARKQATIAYFQGIHEGGASQDVLALKYMETLEAISANPSNKVFLPYESSALMGSLGTIKELFKDASSEATPPVRTAKGK